VCAGYEKDSWRSPAGSHLAYVTQLVAWGYTAGEVEQILLDGTKQSDEPGEDTEEDEDTETFEEVHADEEELMAEQLTAE
jgi:ParB family chromosome partitioning protein